MKTKRFSINSDIYLFLLYLYFWSSLRPGASHGLRAATMKRSGFLAWNLPGCFPLVLFEARRVPWFAGGYHGTFWIYVFYVNIEPHSWHKMTSFLIVLGTCTGKSLSEALIFEAVWGQARPMVCERLPWNVLDWCFLRKHWTTFLTQNYYFLDRSEYL